MLRVVMKRTLAIILLMCTLMGRIPPVLRLHVVANSDSEFDQSVKLQVRDAIVTYLQDEMLQMQDIDQTQAYVKSQLDNLEDVADEVLKQNGLSYRSSLSLGDDSFPEITYGDMVFPAGNYHALRVVLGTGQGHNWWCVLFPPLCLLDTKQVDPNWQPQDGVTYKSWLLKLFE